MARQESGCVPSPTTSLSAHSTPHPHAPVSPLQGARAHSSLSFPQNSDCKVRPSICQNKITIGWMAKTTDILFLPVSEAGCQHGGILVRSLFLDGRRPSTVSSHGREKGSSSLYLALLLFFSSSVISNSLRPHRLQYSRLPCPSLSPGVCSNSCPLSW